MSVLRLSALKNHLASEGPAFRAAAKGTGVWVFSGFEIASSEGIHVLCIYATKVRKVVEELLEGGRDAFERRRRYGF